MSCSRAALLEVAPDQQAEAAGQAHHADQRVVLRFLRLVEPAIARLGQAGLVEHARLQRADVAGEPFAGRRGDQVEVGAGPARAGIDQEHQPADAALLVELGEPVDLGVDRLGDLLGDEAAGGPGEITDQHRGEQREHRQIGERQLEGRRAQQLAEAAHPNGFARGHHLDSRIM